MAIAALVAGLAPAQAFRSRDAFVSEVTVDVGSATGAYTLNITYDQAVVSIAGIAGGTTGGFSGPPVTNAAIFTSGMTRISAFNSTDLFRPMGVASIARVTFNAVGSAGSSSTLGLQIVTLSDKPRRLRLPLSVEASASFQAFGRGPALRRSAMAGGCGPSGRCRANCKGAARTATNEFCADGSALLAIAPACAKPLASNQDAVLVVHLVARATRSVLTPAWTVQAAVDGQAAIAESE